MPRSKTNKSVPGPTGENPFTQPREVRSITMTFRVTPTEHAAMVKAAGSSDRGALVELMREGLGLAIERRSKCGHQ